MSRAGIQNTEVLRLIEGIKNRHLLKEGVLAHHQGRAKTVPTQKKIVIEGPGLARIPDQDGQGHRHLGLQRGQAPERSLEDPDPGAEGQLLEVRTLGAEDRGHGVKGLIEDGLDLPVVEGVRGLIDDEVFRIMTGCNSVYST